MYPYRYAKTEGAVKKLKDFFHSPFHLGLGGCTLPFSAEKDGKIKETDKSDQDHAKMPEADRHF